MTLRGMQDVDALIREGTAAIEEAFTMAKAAQPEGEQGDLDDDLTPFDQAREQSDASQEDEDEDDTQGEHDDEQDERGGSADGDEQDSDFNGGRMSKAYTEVDALPLLQAIDEKLALIPQLHARIEHLETQNATLAKAVQANAHGSATMAKAVAHALNLPVTPKSQQRTPARVPTRVPGAPAMDRSAVMSKAVNAVEAGRLAVQDVATFEVLTNSHGLEAALKQMPHVAALVGEKE